MAYHLSISLWLAIIIYCYMPLSFGLIRFDCYGGIMSCIRRYTNYIMCLQCFAAAHLHVHFLSARLIVHHPYNDMNTYARKQPHSSSYLPYCIWYGCSEVAALTCIVPNQNLSLIASAPIYAQISQAFPIEMEMGIGKSIQFAYVDGCTPPFQFSAYLLNLVKSKLILQFVRSLRLCYAQNIVDIIYEIGK